MTTQPYDVAIVGAGFTGSALAVNLLRALPDGSRLLLLGSPRATGRGLAYGTTNAAHMLNVRAGRMSLFADDAPHFVRWLAASPDYGAMSQSEIADRYIPRPVYGRYVEATLREAIAEAAGRIHIDLVEGTATELQRLDRSFEVRAASGVRYAARALALCLGNHAAGFPFPSEAVATPARPHLIAEPWSDPRLDAIPDNARVLLIGTGLTMVDQVLTLAGRGHTGPLTALSRHGLLPQAHLVTRSDLRALPMPSGPASIRRLFRSIVAAARSAEADGGDWRSIVDGLRADTQDIWRSLDLASRRRFLRHVEAFWSVHRHRMAPSVAAEIGALRDSGRLSLRAGRVLAVSKAANGLTVAFRERGERTISLLPFDWVINCSGVRTALRTDPLLGSLTRLGLARGDTLGRGLEVNERAEVIGQNGSPTAGLFALGPLTAGCFLEITAVPEIRHQCAAVAAELARLTADCANPVRRLAAETPRLRIRR